MATISSYKIATRKWSSDTMGSGKLSFGISSECIIPSDLNQTSSTNYVNPSSNTNGAAPITIIPNSSKCVTQKYLDNLYAVKDINVNSNIHLQSGTLQRYSIKIDGFYDNVSAPANVTSFSNIYTDLTITIRFEYFKTTLDTSPTDYATTTCAVPCNSLTIGKIKFDILSASKGPVADYESQGNISYSLFLNRHLTNMYKYYSGTSTSYKYNIVVSVTPEYRLTVNSPFTPHKHCVYSTVTTSTATTPPPENSVTATCACSFTDVSTASEFSYSFTMTVANIDPVGITNTSNWFNNSNVLNIYSNNSTITISRKTYTSSTLTVKGTVVKDKNPEPIESIPPSIIVEIKYPSYKTFTQTFVPKVA